MLFQEYYATAVRLGWFDPGFYFDLLQAKGISVADTGLSLFEHYATVGWKRGLSPCERFSVRRYLARYQDVAERDMDPLYHFLVRGVREQRRAEPLFDHPDEVQLIGLIENPPGDRIALAQANGISAFCLRHDAGQGREIADSLGPDIEFCLFVDPGGLSLEARYDFAREIMAILCDPRHLRVLGKPLLVVDRPERLDDAPLTLDLWRAVARGAGLGGLFIIGLPGAGAGESPGLDGVIDAPAGGGISSVSTSLPVFPGFMPDRDPAAWPEAGAGAADVFLAWSASLGERTEPLHRRSLPRLAFIDAGLGGGDGQLEFLKGAAPAGARERQAMSDLRHLADAVKASSRLPVLVLCDPSAGPEQVSWQRLMASPGERGIECFALAATGEHGDLPAGALRLDDPAATGWSRDGAMAYLAGLLRDRGDLVVVSDTPGTAGLLAPFAARGHATVSLLHGPAGDAELQEIARHAGRIIASSSAVRDQAIASGAVVAGDIRVIEPPRATDPPQAWARYAEEIAHCLAGLGNDGRRLRSTGRTLGRQAVADDLCVVIPSYNHRPYLAAALDSVLAQSLRPGEIRVIDDGSDDGSAELVRRLASDHLGIIVEARENRGAQATINQAVAETRCPIVAVMNSDDRWHPSRVEELIGDLRRPGGADAVFSRLRFIGPRHRRDPKRDWYEAGVADHNAGTPLWLALMFRNFFFTTSNLMARRDSFMAVGGFGPLRYCHDLDYMLAAMAAGQSVRFEQQTLCDYRLHARNTIDEDVEPVLFEEAWIIVKCLRRTAGRLASADLATIAQRIDDKGLASRVLGILQALARGGVRFDDRLAYSAPQFLEVLEHAQPRGRMDSADLAHEIARLLAAQDAGQAVVAD